MRPVLAFALALAACKAEAPAPPDAGAPSVPPEIQITAERKDLVFSYHPPESQEFKTATSIAEIPEAARARVIVTDLSLSPEVRQAGRYIYVADLSKPRDDGSFPVALESRFGFEHKELEPAAAEAGGGVIVYSASWCGVCRRVKALLSELGVPYVEKDIEASQKANMELLAKAKAAGVQPTGVPVIDVAGTLLLGLDETTLKSTLRSKGLLR